MSTYIKLSDVQNAINNNKFTEHKTALLYFDDVVQKINSLPSISFEEMIKEMIEEYEKDQWRTSRWSQNYYDLWVYIKWLRLVLDKFTSLPK